MEALRENNYTIDYIYSLPEGVRGELIDGEFFMMAPPSSIHQRIIGHLYVEITNHIRAKGGSCEPFIAPFGVFLGGKNNYVEPDLSVICDKNKITDKGCEGAPDWIIEVVSPGSHRNDYMVKLFKYRTAGVKEYWIVDPRDKTVTIYNFVANDMEKKVFSDELKSSIFDDLTISLSTFS